MLDQKKIVQHIKSLAQELGFEHVGICDIDLSAAEKKLQQWLEKKFHGSMDYMEKHGTKRSRPDELLPGTIRVISVGMNYLSVKTNLDAMQQKEQAYISRYALGRDYHKILRSRLKQLAKKIDNICSHQYRVFADSAPVLEKPLAEKAGIGWMGKHTLILNRHAGSWFFLGEIYTNLPLPIDSPTTEHCGTCTACIEICPTQAIVAPYQLDARRCISYLTIENKNAIPEEFRKVIGNRIFGCDDCQLVCPWNKFANLSKESDFQPRHNLENASLIELFMWSEQEFLQKTAGSPLRRAGYSGWLRNIAVALGNAPTTSEVIHALKYRLSYPCDMVKEHIIWALNQHHSYEY